MATAVPKMTIITFYRRLSLTAWRTVLST